MNKLTLLWVLLSLATLFFSPGTFQGNSQDWSPPMDISEGASSNLRTFGFPVCDPYQNLHVFWSDIFDGGTAIYHRAYVDGIWTNPNDILAVSYKAWYLKSAVSPVNDTIHLIWFDSNLFNSNLFYTKAPLLEADNPRAWEKPMVIGQGVSSASMVIDSKGSIHIVYASSDSSRSRFGVFHKKSENDGKDWSRQTEAFSKTFQLASYIRIEMAIDESDRIHVGLTLRSQDYGVQSEVGYIRSADAGETWGSYQLIDNTAVAFQGLEWIAPFAFGKNEVHLTWHDTRRMHQWSSDGGATWSEPAEIMALGAAFGGANGLTKDSAGTVHAVLAVLDGVYSVTWDGKRWGTPERIDSREIDPHGQYIVACGGNVLHVVYYDRIGELTVWHSLQEVNAPAINPKALPTAAQPVSQLPTPTPTLMSTSQPIVAPLPEGGWIEDPTQKVNPGSSQFIPIVAGALPPVLLILILMLLIRRHSS